MGEDQVMRHFLFEEAVRALVKLLRKTGPGKHSGGGFPGGTGIDARQKCVVKAQYSNSVEAHRAQLEHYLTREGTERDGSRTKLYGTDLEEYRRHMVDKNFRIFLSPKSDKTDLTRLANTFIKRLELQTGKKFYWQAANHHNAAHPHAHLLINGVDQNGRDITFPYGAGTDNAPFSF
jgi:type IV secretory pathway VirD2 relaxase